MWGSLGRLFDRLGRCTSGNAALLVAIGLPALIGGAGLAVDTAQWYVWQKELQFAADEAAIAGAWSKAYKSPGTDYRTRALQELAANRQVVDFAGTPTISLADYNGGSDNSVVVEITATRRLPFTGFLTGNAATVRAYSQAAFTEGSTYTSCLLAVNPDEKGAVTIGGNAKVKARCGIAALSTSPDSIVVNGNPDLDPGWVISAGGIDDWIGQNTDASIHEYLTGMVDPFAALTPPTNNTAQTYQCSGGTTSYTASVTTRTTVQDIKYSGTKSNKIDTVVSTTTISDTGNILGTEPADKNTKTGSASGYPAISTVPGTVSSSTSGSGKNAVTTYFRTDRVTTTAKTITAVTSSSSPVLAAMQPGTYKKFEVSCNTTMASGIYVIDGGDFSINAQNSLNGSGVMIVLKNGAGIKINGGAAIALSAMTSSQLVAAGVSAANAQKLAGMLVFEDRNSGGNKSNGGGGNIVNGNASTMLDGKIYLPVSPIRINGTAKVSSQCLMIAANTITILGNADFDSFCPAGQEEKDVVATSITAVKLVS